MASESATSSAVVTPSNSTFLESLINAIKGQFSNQHIVGVLTVSAANLVSHFGWLIVHEVKDFLFRSLFTVYIVPRNSHQFEAFQSWLKAQPNVYSNIMEIYLENQVSAQNRQGNAFSRGRAQNQPTPEVASLDDEASKASDRLSIVPTLGSSFYLLFGGKYLWISTGTGTVNDKKENPEVRFYVDNNNLSVHPTITVFGRNADIMKRIIREGNRLLRQAASRNTTIYTADASVAAHRNPFNQENAWSVAAVRPVRKIESIILPGTEADDILKDCEDFLSSEEWYTDRGIPYRRGYLLHGKPGCGKSSLITAIAGHLNLNVYIVSLAAPGMTDDALQNILNSAPPRVLLLMEDIDSVFATALNSNKDVDGSDAASSAASEPTTPATGTSTPKPSGIFGGPDMRKMREDIRHLTFAGILNAIDGVAGQTGRLLFMTTNHKERLDPALIRPGRIDYEVCFKEATTDQARRLFYKFYSKKVFRPEDSDYNPDKNSAEVLSEHNLKIEALANKFVELIPANTYTTSKIQGLCMQHRTDPDAVIIAAEEARSQTESAAAKEALGVLTAAPSRPKSLFRQFSLEKYEKLALTKPLGPPLTTDDAADGGESVDEASMAPSNPKATMRRAKSLDSR